jgi:hypothetical protein
MRPLPGRIYGIRNPTIGGASPTTGVAIVPVSQATYLSGSEEAGRDLIAVWIGNDSVAEAIYVIILLGNGDDGPTAEE